MKSFKQKTFSTSANRPFIEKKHARPSSQSSGGVKSSERCTMTVNTEKTPTNNKLQQSISENGDNYQYY